MKFDPLLIKSYMKPSPFYIQKTDTFRRAYELMTSKNICHLPVFHSSSLVGLVSKSDMDIVHAFWEETRIDDIRVSDFFQIEPCIFDPDTPLIIVCQVMAQRKRDCVLICDNNQLVGIFTWIDMADTLTHFIDEKTRSEWAQPMSSRFSSKAPAPRDIPFP